MSLLFKIAKTCYEWYDVRRTYQLINGQYWLSRSHKDSADSRRISDDSRDKWKRAQPKYGAESNKKAYAHDGGMRGEAARISV